MADRLSGKRVAILVAEGFDRGEMTEPRKALRKAGAEVEPVSPAEEIAEGAHAGQGA